MARIGIFGGSFNPIHLGHIALADWVVEHELVDEVWLMVSPENPLKQNKTLLNEKVRFEMVQLAVEGHKGVVACNFEFSLPRPSYTWNTLCRLENTFSQHQFSLIIGADNWQCFSLWAHYQEIQLNYKIFVYPRKGNLDSAKMKNVFFLNDAPLFPVSSTQIRELIGRGEEFQQFLNQKVYHLIRRNNYYLKQ